MRPCASWSSRTSSAPSARGRTPWSRPCGGGTRTGWRCCSGHFPIDAIHPFARPAAVAAECAGEQGRFGELASLLFAQQDSLGAKPWARFAANAGVADAAAFDRCLRERRTMPAVDRDAKLGTETGLEVTPTLVINGTMYPGTISERALDSLVMRAGPR